MCGMRPVGVAEQVATGSRSSANSSFGDSSGCVSDCALDLLDLDQPLVAVARRGPGRVDRAALLSTSVGIHAAVGEVGVVRDRQQLVAGLALAVHPVPQILGMRRVERAERHRRHLGAVLEEDVAVQVQVVRRRGPLVGAERRELAGLVAWSAIALFSFQTRARDLGRHQLLDRLVRRSCVVPRYR